MWVLPSWQQRTSTLHGLQSLSPSWILLSCCGMILNKAQLFDGVNICAKREALAGILPFSNKWYAAKKTTVSESEWVGLNKENKSNSVSHGSICMKPFYQKDITTRNPQQHRNIHVSFLIVKMSTQPPRTTRIFLCGAIQKNQMLCCGSCYLPSAKSSISNAICGRKARGLVESVGHLLAQRQMLSLEARQFNGFQCKAEV